MVVFYDGNERIRARLVNGRRTRNWFLKGPVEGRWLTKAANLPGGKCLHVALAIHHAVALTKGKSGPLTSKHLKKFGVTDRRQKYRALKDLEAAGLIRVTRPSSKSPLVEILAATDG